MSKIGPRREKSAAEMDGKEFNNHLRKTFGFPVPDDNAQLPAWAVACSVVIAMQGFPGYRDLQDRFVIGQHLGGEASVPVDQALVEKALGRKVRPEEIETHTPETLTRERDKRNDYLKRAAVFE